jgi:hypothetical protein
MKKFFLFTAILIVILLVAGWFYLPHALEKIENNLVESVKEQGFTLNYDNLTWNLRSPGISLENVTLVSTDHDNVDVQLTNVSAHLSWRAVFKRNFTTINSISVADGRIHYTPVKAKDTETHQKDASIRVNQFVITNVDVEISDETSSEFTISVLQGSVDAQKRNGLWKVDVLRHNIEMIIVNGKMESMFKYHGLELDSLHYKMSDRSLSAAGLQISPNRYRGVLDAEVPYSFAHLTISVPEIAIKGLDWTYNESFSVRAEYLNLHRLFFNIYQNMELPIPDRKKKLPTAWIENTGFDFLVDTVHVSNSRLNYTEKRVSATLNPSNFWMDQWDLKWYGYGTADERPASHTVRSTMVMMDSAPVTVEIEFPYAAPLYGFSLAGEIESTEFSAFNPVLEPMEGFHFQSGSLVGARFAFDGDDVQSSGTLFINFEDVHIALSREPRFRQRVLAWAANTFVVEGSTGGESTEVEIRMEREQNRSVANFWAQSLKTGLIEALLK